jgi:hypothetical protein
VYRNKQSQNENQRSSKEEATQPAAFAIPFSCCAVPSLCGSKGFSSGLWKLRFAPEVVMLSWGHDPGLLSNYK